MKNPPLRKRTTTPQINSNPTGCPPKCSLLVHVSRTGEFLHRRLPETSRPGRPYHVKLPDTFVHFADSAEHGPSQRTEPVHFAAVTHRNRKSINELSHPHRIVCVCPGSVLKKSCPKHFFFVLPC